MNIKRFRFVCRLLSTLLNFIAILSAAIIVIGLFVSIFGKQGLEQAGFTIDDTNFSFIHFHSGQFSLKTERLAALFVAPPFFSVFAYTLWKGGQLFNGLELGMRPFSASFVESVKHISKLLIILDLFLPVAYSLAMSLLIKNGYYISLGFTETFITGLILYVVAEIFNYGIELQDLSDETI